MRRRREFSRFCRGALVAVAAVATCGAVALPIPPRTAGGAFVEAAALPSATVAFNERKDRFIDALDGGSEQHFDHDAAVGLLLLERAGRTGDHGDVPRANELILASLLRIDLTKANDQFSPQHGGAFTFLNLALRFGGEPDLLYPETYGAIVRGEYPDGADRPQRSLLAYRDQLFAAAYDSQNIGLDIRSGEPWDPAGEGGYNGTENHKLQVVVTGMLLSDLYAADVVGDVPVKDDTEALDDQWHYFRDAFVRYSMAWDDGRADHFTRDVAQSEEDSINYLPLHLGDYWLLRDLYSDPVVTAHAEVLIDRLLADWTEDLVGPLHTGPVERVYDVELPEGLSFQEHVLNYLLFDNLGGSFRVESDELFDFGGWGNVAVATSDYVPGAPGFPMVLVDVAKDKGSGYTVREGGADHNWVESDFALGFRLDDPLFNEDMTGGFQVVADGGGPTAGRMVTVFHGATPFSKDKPTVHPQGVQSERTALLRSVAQGAPARLWVQTGFDEVVTDGRWLFVAQPSWSGRTVYLAVGAARGSLSGAGSVDGGDVFAVEAGDTLIWDVATSEDVASFEEFRAAMLDAAATIDGEAIDFVSPFSGAALHLVDDPARRTVDGEPVDWAAYDFSFSSPWGAHAYGEAAAAVTRDDQSATWNWDPDGSGTLSAAPAKEVVNGPQ